MNDKKKKILIWILAVVIWIGGIFIIYQITWTPKVNYAGIKILTRPVEMSRSGQYVQMSFIEANAPYLLILTIVCFGGAALAIKKQKKE